MRAATFKLRSPKSGDDSTRVKEERNEAGSRHPLHRRLLIPASEPEFAASEEDEQKKRCWKNGKKERRAKRRDEKGEAFLSLGLSVLSRCPRGLLRRRRLALSGVKGGEGNETKRPRQGEHDETDEEEQQSDGWLCRKRGKRKKRETRRIGAAFSCLPPVIYSPGQQRGRGIG